MRRPLLGSLCVLATTLPAVGQAFTPNASAATALTVFANRSTGATAAPGTPLTNGFQLQDAGSGGSSASVHIGLTVDPVTQVLTYVVEDGYVLALGTGGWNQQSYSGPHDTVLNLVAPSATPAVIRITWNHVPRNWGNGASIDLGFDGTIDWQGNWNDPPPGSVRLSTVIDSFGQRILTHTYARGYANIYLGPPYLAETGTGGSSLRIEVAPHRGSLALVSGTAQSVGAGEAFAPIVFRFADDNGQPVAGEPVTFSVLGAASLLGPTTVMTDAQGLAVANVTSLPGGGSATMFASAPELDDPISVPLFAQNLSAARLGPVVALVVNASGLQPGTPVPYVVLVSLPGVTPLATSFGPVCTNPFDPNTHVLEDSIGVFGFVSASGTGAIGTPGLQKTYPLPPGTLTGLTVLLQAIGIEPGQRVLRTNCVTLTL